MSAIKPANISYHSYYQSILVWLYLKYHICQKKCLDNILTIDNQLWCRLFDASVRRIAHGVMACCLGCFIYGGA